MERLRILLNQMVSEKTADVFLNEIRNRPPVLLVKLVQERESLNSLLNQIGISPGLDRVGVITALEIWSKEYVKKEQGPLAIEKEEKQRSMAIIEKEEEQGPLAIEKEEEQGSMAIIEKEEEKSLGTDEKNVTYLEQLEKALENLKREERNKLISYLENNNFTKDMIASADKDGTLLVLVQNTGISDYVMQTAATAGLRRLLSQTEKDSLVEKTFRNYFCTTSYTLPQPSEVVRNALNSISPLFPDSPQNIIYEVSGLPLPPCPTLTIIHTSKFLLGLPAEIGANNRPDLRLLDGDLDDPVAKSETVTSLLSKLDESKDRTFCDPLMILSGSGVGKTKALFDMLKEKFGVWIDCTFGQEGKDMCEMFANIRTLVTMNPNHLEAFCTYEVHLAVAARFVVLALYILQGFIKQPREWLFSQMNGLASRHYDSCLDIVRKHLRFKIPFEDNAQFFKIVGFISKIIGYRLLTVIDEANSLLDMHPTAFHSLRKQNDPPCRPLFTLMTGALISPDSVLLVAGTRLELKDTELWESLVAKSGTGAPITPVVIYDLPLANSTRCRKLMKRLFHSDFVDYALKLFKQKIPLPARFRYITTWVDTYVKDQFTLAASVSLFVSDLIGSSAPWSLNSMINYFVARHAVTANSLFCELIVHYLIDDGIIKDTSTAQWMAGGFCRLSKIGESYSYKIEEATVIDCILRYLRSNNISLSEYYVLKIMNTYDSSVAGVLMDSLLALCFYELPQQSSFLDGLWDPSHASSIIRIKNGDSLLNEPLLIYEDCYALPKHYAGPDGMAIINGYLFIVAIKTTQRENRSVDERQVKKNFKTTDLANLKLEEDEKFLILDNLCNSPPLAVFRIHIVLPCAPWNSDSFKVGIRSTCNTQKFEIPNHDPLLFKCEQYSFDIDLSNIYTCGLFSKKVCTMLSSIFGTK